jgi:hypothetical protein
VKKAQFIKNSVEIQTMFKWASPPEVIKALKTYCSSFYGCMLWDLGSDGARQVFNAWGTTVRLTWDCPRETRTFLVQQVLSCGFRSARTDILARYSKFFLGLRASASREVSVLANLVSRDLLTTTGKNLRTVRDATNLDPWQASPAKLKEALSASEMVEVPEADEWRVEYLCTLLRQREEARFLANEERLLDLGDLINSLVI